MNRKFRELIPLFSIGLMIIGAIAILIVMNMDNSSKKTNTKLENTNKVNSVRENDKKDIEDEKEDEEKEEIETSKPVASIDNNKTEKDDQTKLSATTTVKTTTGGKLDSSQYIQSMVDGIIGSTTQTTSNVTSAQIQTQTQVQTQAPAPVTNTQPVNSSTINTNNNTAQKQHTITQTPVQRATISAYTIAKSVKVGNYSVAVTTNNNIVSYNTSNGVIVSTLNSANVSKMKAFGNSVYTFEPSSKVMKKYDLSNGTLSLVSKVNMVSCADFLVTNTYVFILKEDSRLYAYRLNNGTIEQAQSGFVMESGGIASISSANGNTITASVNNGGTYTYTFDGVSFNRR